MSLGTKTILILLLAVVGYAVIDLLVQRQFILPSFAELEREEAQRNVARCADALRREVHHLDQFCQDWSAWDDTLDFVEGRTPSFVADNLDLRTFLNADLNYIGALDNQGRVVWSACYDLRLKTPLELPELPKGSWPREHVLLQHLNFDSTISGFITTARGPMLIASRPIVASYKQDHIGGTIIMGRFLDDTLVATLRNQTQVDVNLLTLASLPPAQSKEFLQKGARGETVWMDEESPRAILAHVLLSDVYGKPALLMNVRLPRLITERGNGAVLMDALGGLAGGIITLLAMAVLMQWAVIRPLRRFTDHVAQMAGRGQLDAVPIPRRKDEIRSLATAFNLMQTRVRETFAERLQAEQAFHDSETRMGAVLNAAPDAILVINRSGLVTTANAAVHAVLGWHPEELVGKHVECIARVERRERVQVLLDRLFGADAIENPVPSGVFTARRKDGSAVSVHIAASRTSVGDDAQVALIIRDITELNAMHERLARSQRLAEIGQMGASLAHEIRNPVAGISGAAQVLLHSHAGNDAHRELLEEVLRQSRRIENTVRQLLGYARPFQPQMIELDLVSLVRAILERFERDECRAPGSVSLAAPETLRGRVDIDLFTQMILNLLLNASQAMERGEGVRVEMTTDGQDAVLHVDDEGPGFEDVETANKFQPFKTSKVYGTGLGLSICQRIVEAHGGHIALSNREPRGARVTVRLPRGLNA